MSSAVKLIEKVKSEVRLNGYMTPFGIRECKTMELSDIKAVFGDTAADFWRAVRANAIRFT